MLSLLFFTALISLFIYAALSIFVDVFIFSKLYRHTKINPLFWKVVYQDLHSNYRNKNPFFSAEYKNFRIRGNPDLLFRFRLLPIYILVDYKSRQGPLPNLYETTQLTLYMWIIKKKRPFCSVKSFVRYGSGTLTPVHYSPYTATQILAAAPKLPTYD